MDTGRISEGPGGSPGLVSSVSDKRGNPVSSRWESYSVSRVSKPPLTDRGHRFFPSFFQRLTGSAAAFAAAGEPAPWKLFPDPLTGGYAAGQDSSRRVAVGRTARCA